MMIDVSHPDFSTLFTTVNAKRLLQRLAELENGMKKVVATPAIIDAQSVFQLESPLGTHLRSLTQCRQQLSAFSATHNKPDNRMNSQEDYSENDNNEQAATDWLITLFNALFAEQQVELVRGKHEPEYFPADNSDPARIEFAHGFFASALHEISHWCIAGGRRRQLADFGYWYAPDGRSNAQQQAFEHIEIKPQALECLFTLACKRSFQVSQDNLFADFDTSSSTFADDVYQQASQYIAMPQTLPRDAKTLLQALLTVRITQ